MRSFYPWRLFWKLFLTLLIFLNILFVTSLGIASFLIDFNFYSSRPFFMLGIYFFLSVLGSLAFAWRFSSPLKRVILKALRISNKKQFEGRDQVEEVLEEEPGEYFELEVALDKIRKKLKKRRMQLAREREESQALMSSLDDAILSVTPDLRLKFFNSRFINQFLDSAQSKMLNQGELIPLAQIFREPEILELFKRSLSERETQSCSLRLYSIIDGADRDFLLKVSPLRDQKSSQIFGALALFHDVTDIKKADRIRIEFVENASHELRTPLTSIKGFVDTAKEDVLAGRYEQVGSFMSTISRNVDRLSELVHDMLTLSSLESGARLRREPVGPDQVTQEVIERLGAQASQKQILIKTVNMAEPFSADPSKVEQVLQNLLSNAIKYIQTGGQVQVLWEQDPTNVRLHVIDNGPGIAEVHLPRLFERFYRIDKGRSRDVGGTGLGLSIVKHIVQSHGGSVQVKSEVGKGSEFICSFPRRSL
ncbi:MAG: PAS domain-containing sensor histidine kinase [Bdellovibrio sp. CG10_big_fil_rev_8_21_14_0_10_47_8]|nr:MAG: PAS domain-containing sensor histidine kinase [Bdellovibrio sp. CG10_big_fil_rev_8_21_14_0_10_47_8]